MIEDPLGWVCAGYLVLAVVLLVVCYWLAPEDPYSAPCHGPDVDDDLDRLR